MKRKFFLTIFSVLLFTVTVVTLLHLYFLKAERLRLIDQQIETSASLVISSDLTKIPLDDIEDLEDFFHELLESQKINKIILIRDLSGKILYSSKNAEWLPDTFQKDVRWQTAHEEGHTIRVLSVEIPQLKKLLQIGMVLDSEISLWRRVDAKYIAFSIATIFLILAVSIFLTSILLTPLRNLSEYLKHLSTEIEKGKFEGKEGAPLFAKDGVKDEFSNLTHEVLKLRDKISVHYNIFQTWTAQMAHSLKTPLTIIKSSLEELASAPSEKTKEIAKDSLTEVQKLDSTISGFLAWASLAGSLSKESSLEAIPACSSVAGVLSRLEKVYPGRLDKDLKGSLRVFADRFQFEQSVFNLAENALKYC